ncbi:hypothetical protein [Polymorphospora rubra]|uniref:hypothetical protein n=1 Tax=Polymorphospora rubra TaxID=338584 RepID=UPI0033FE8F01
MPSQADQPAPGTATVELKLARVSLLAGALDRARTAYAELADAHPTVPAVFGEATLGLAQVEESAGRPAEAASHYETCLAAETDTGYSNRLSAGLGLSRCLAQLGRAEQALAVARSTANHIEQIGLDRSDVGVEIRAIIATVQCELGQPGLARKPIAEALEIVPEITDRHELMSVYHRASATAVEAGHPGRAMELLGRAMDASLGHDHQRIIGMLRALYGGLLLRQPPVDPELAHEMLTQALADLGTTGSVLEVIRCRNDLLSALILLDRTEEAVGGARELLDSTAGRSTPERIDTLLLLAAAQSILGDTDGARGTCATARDELEDLADSAQTSRLWSQLGEAMTQVGETDAAIVAYRRAIQSLGVEMTPALRPTRPADDDRPVPPQRVARASQQPRRPRRPDRG